MKPLIGVIIAVLLCGGVYKCTYSDTYRKVMYPNEYASTNIPEYKESEINKLKRELDDQRLKSLRLQAALDSCKFNVRAFETMTPSVRVVYKTKKASKALDDCNRDYMKLKAEMGELIGAKSMMEVEKDLEINKLKRQMDTCAYFVQEMDKALMRQGDEITKLTNQKDSLTSVLETPIEYVSERPCFKTKRGAKIQAHAFPHKQTIIVNMAPFEKKEFKEAKKSCKSAK